MAFEEIAGAPAWHAVMSRSHNTADTEVAMKTVREILVPSLVIVALYTPLIWYLAELRAHYPGTTDFLELQLIEQIIIAVLTIAPPWCLSFLKISWKPELPIT